MNSPMNNQELTGEDRTHIRQYDKPRFAFQPEAADAFFSMRKAAAEEGIDLHPFSAFRDFKSQLGIWNKKFSGKMPLYAEDGTTLDSSLLDEHELVFAILNWSALPGGSRHHWGTDIDVIDMSVVSSDYQVRLLPEETREGGVFYKLHCWLDESMDQFGFFRPYARYQNGVFPEPWHLSYAPISRYALKELTLEIVADTIERNEILGKKVILELLPEVFESFIQNIADQSLS